MSALMVDVIQGSVSNGVCNAACNAGGKLLKVVELQYRYGTPGPGGRHKVLDLTMDGVGEPPLVEAVKGGA